MSEVYKVCDGVCFVIYDNKEFILDEEQFNIIINYNKKLKFINNDDIYPSYKSSNSKLINLFEILYKVSYNNINITYQNNNIYDLRKNNITYTTKINKIYNGLTLIYEGVFVENNKGGIYKNPIYKKLSDNGNIEYIMLCNQNKECILCPKSYKCILEFEEKINNNNKIIWTYRKNKDKPYIDGHLYTKFNENNKNVTKIDIKKVIMYDYVNKTNNTNIYKYIDDNILNNKYENFKLDKITNKNKSKEENNNIIDYENLEEYDDITIINIKMLNDKIKELNENEYKILTASYGKHNKLIVNTILSNEDFKYIQKFNLNWHYFKGEKQDNEKNIKCTGGYVRSTLNGKCVYLHILLKERYENKPGDEYTVDHINQIKLDNRNTNLRWATPSEQNANRSKMNRKYNAQDLPDGITQQMIPKYVTYIKECYNKEKQLYREFFSIEHPKQQVTKIGTSKSEKISIFDKLKEAKEIVSKLDAGTYYQEKEEKKNNNILPQHIKYKELEDKYLFNYDNNNKNERKTLKKIAYKKNYTFETYLPVFIKEIQFKYDDYVPNYIY